MVDQVVPRSELRATLARLISVLMQHDHAAIVPEPAIQTVSA